MQAKLPHTTMKASSMCLSCVRRLFPRSRRGLSSSATTNATADDGMDAFTRAIRGNPTAQRQRQQDRPAAQILRPAPSTGLQSIFANATYEARNKPSTVASLDEPYHVNVYSHKHNTHITFTDPNRNPILSLSAGDIGLKKAARGSYEASYQLAVFAFSKMMEKQWRMGGKKSKTMTRTMRDVDKIEILLRGYGPGREAFQKAILGVEGRLIKPKVVRVTDGTRLKFGGCRSRQVRRL